MTHNNKAYFHKYDWLCHLATLYNTKKGGRVTKPIIVKYAIKLCVIQGVEKILIK